MEKELAKLIKSLNKSEKRYFKLYIKKHNPNEPTQQNSLHLFEYIENNKENMLYEKYKTNDKMLSRFTSAKNYLNKKILRSLRSFNEENSIERKIQNLLIEAKILEKKQLYKQTLKHINKGEQLAEKYEYLYLAIEFLKIKKKIVIISQNKNVIEELKYLQKKINKFHQKIEIENHFRAQYEYCFLLTKKTKTSLRQYESLYENLEIYRKSIRYKKMLTINARLSYNAFMNLYYLKKGELKKKEKQLSKTLELYNQNEAFKKENFGRYLGVISNYASNCAHERDKKKLKNFSEQLENLITKNKHNLKHNIRLREYKIYVDLIYWLAKEDFQKVAELGIHFEKEFKSFSKKISPSRLLMFYFNFAQANYFLKNDKEALQWIQEVYNIKPSVQSFQVYIRVRVLECLINYDPSNLFAFQYLIKSIARFLTKQKNKNKAVLDLINDFKKIVMNQDIIYAKVVESIKRNKLSKEWEEISYWINIYKISNSIQK